MRKFFLVIMIGFLVMVGASVYGAETPQYQIEMEKIIEAPIAQKGLRFQISVKSWGAETNDILVKVKFQELYYIELQGMKEVEDYTNDEGKVFFTLPYYNKESGRGIIVSLPDFPKTGEEMATIVYVRHLKYFGHTFTAVEGIGKKENYFTETSPCSNITMIQSSSAKQDIKKILEAADHGMLSLISVDHIFFEIEFGDDGSLKVVRLRHDYLERWSKYTKEIRPYEKTVLGFFPIDEPYWAAVRCEISFREMRLMLEEVSFQIKKSFPTKKVIGSIFITEAEIAQGEIFGKTFPEDAQAEYGIPLGYDWVGIYHYRTDYQGSATQFEETWGKRFQSFDKHLKSWQKFVLVPGTFSFTRLDTTELEQELVDLAPRLYAWAKRDLRFVAIMPFLWPSQDNLVGLEEMPNLQKVWEKIGKEITQK